MKFLLAGLLIFIAGPALADGYWYYCDSLHGYFPYVQTCPEPFRPVVPSVQPNPNNQAVQAVPTASPESSNVNAGNSCGEPETSDQKIIDELNSKIGKIGGPSGRAVALRGAPPNDWDASQRHTCWSMPTERPKSGFCCKIRFRESPHGDGFLTRISPMAAFKESTRPKSQRNGARTWKPRPEKWSDADWRDPRLSTRPIRFVTRS
jgi:hypothetical protein